MCLIKQMKFFFSKIYVFTSQVNHKNKRVLSIKTIEYSTGAEETGIELASNVDRELYTGKAGWAKPHQLWLIKSLPQLSQRKQDTPRWLPGLCTPRTI